jgi:RNA polymerase sigma-70 factor
MITEATQQSELPKECESVMEEIFNRCNENAPNFGVRLECFKESLQKTARKYLLNSTEPVSTEELNDFLRQIQAEDLFLALACANGSERAWWEFDHQHRSYLERVARHLASTDIDAQEVVDTVYVELYGTRVVDGERVSKFSTYSGRGSLRGWLRTVIWHSLVDLHRASHDEVSLDEMTENVGEGFVHASFAEAPLGGEDEMVEQIAKQRYRKATVSAIETAFANLDAHEKLLLLYYHVENLKLREIARMVESQGSPLRDWFQRKSPTREKNPESRIHESTIMRWLEKSYAKVLQLFRTELRAKYELREDEIEICMELATQDLAGRNLYQNLTTT